MSQSRKMSLVEQLASVFIGFVVSLIIQFFLMPAMGKKFTLGEDLIVIVVFTIASILRGYLVRRVFNFLHVKQLVKQGKFIQ